MNLQELLQTVVGSAIGVAIAGALAVYFALSRVRRERTFDRRSGWHETSFQRLIALAELMESAAARIESSAAPKEIHGALRSITELLPSTLEHLNQRHLFASNEAAEAITNFLGALDEYVVMPIEGEDAVGDAARIQTIARFTRQAAHRISDDYRTQLGMKPLNPKWQLFDRQITLSRQFFELVNKYGGKDNPK